MSTNLPSSSTPPTVNTRQSSLSLPHIPGGFDAEYDLSPLEADSCCSVDFMTDDAHGDLPTTEAEVDHPQDESSLQLPENPDTATGQPDYDDSFTSALPPLPDRDDSSLLPLSSDDGDRSGYDNQTLIEEKEMQRKLMEMESSFLPEPSTIDLPAAHQNTGADDTYLVGVPGGDTTEQAQPDDRDQPFTTSEEASHTVATTEDQDQNLQRTPAESENGATVDDIPNTPSEEQEDNTTMLETMESSPAVRIGERDPPTLSEDAEEFNQASHEESPMVNSEQAVQLTPRPTRESSRSVSPTQSRSTRDSTSGSVGGVFGTGSRRGRRPKYLASRQSAHRLSYSSVTSNNTETSNSDANFGADYALQSGGAAPGNLNHPQTGQRQSLARSVSLGSMASGVSGYAEESSVEKRNPSAGPDGPLQTLDEEDAGAQSYPEPFQQDSPNKDPSPPTTPKARPSDNNVPTDTAIAERIKDIQVPSTFAKQFRESHSTRGLSPDKRTGAATPSFARSGRTMTLKEQSSTIDRLSKENFDLKMRIHFLSEALNKRSEEGIKEMISENVELKSDKLKLQKDNQGLKRKIRDLEKQLKDQQSDKDSMVNHDPEGSDDDNRDQAQGEEALWLRERVETYELEIEKLRSESIARESEKRRLAEMVKSLSDGRPVGSDVGAREERDMWKDMLDAETAAREQAEEENRKLRDETQRLRNEMNFTMGTTSRPGHVDRMDYATSSSTAPERGLSRSATIVNSGSSGLVELDLLKQENAELRKEVSAQTSMLTSRNREKERLYQEIEELKLGQRRDGDRSVAGDSIFDRSASRAHERDVGSRSRASDGTRGSHNSDPDREDIEIRNGQLRDQVSGLKLENQAIRDQLEEYVQELESLDKAYQADVDQAEEEMQNLQQERDQALQMADERDAAFQDLRAEAQEELDALGYELDQKIEESQRLGEELRNQDENLRALQAEMRSASEGIIRLEEDAQNNLERYKTVQLELEESNREMESLEKSLFEANTKVQRLTVQIESSQNEIAFLREEQDGDKIKISDLESELKTYRMSLHSEKEKASELEQRLAEERHQREVVGSKEKQEVQRIMNELNREASAAKEEARKLKKSLSSQEIETSTWRERLMDLENNLRETLGDLTGSRSSLISNIMKLQRELESKALELEGTRSKLDEKESLLRNRDALLESHGLESRKLAELLDRERHAHRADKQSFDKALKSHHQASRTITQSNSRISELEAARDQDRKRFMVLEQQLKDQLSERNSMLLSVWKHLSAMCGPDWAHSNSLINGNLPSQEVIGNILFWPGFSRNLQLAIRTVDSVVSGFKNRIRDVERDLAKKYQTLEHTLTSRVKKLDRMEESFRNMRAQLHSKGYSISSSEAAQLRSDNRLLRTEISLLETNSRSRGPSPATAAGVTAGLGQSPSRTSRSFNRGSEVQPSSLVRHNSMVERPSEQHRPASGLTRSSTGLPPSQSSSDLTVTDNTGAMVRGSRHGHGRDDPTTLGRLPFRLRELEKRLKGEREARLVDRNGARERLAERDEQIQRLKAQMERMQIQMGVPTEVAANYAANRSQGRRSGNAQESQRNRGEQYGHGDEHSSSEGEGICVDIEV